MKKAFTVVELLVAIIFMVVIGLLIFAGCRNLTGANNSRAEDNLRTWLTAQYPESDFEIVGATCNGMSPAQLPSVTSKQRRLRESLLSVPPS